MTDRKESRNQCGNTDTRRKDDTENPNSCQELIDSCDYNSFDQSEKPDYCSYTENRSYCLGFGRYPFDPRRPIPCGEDL